MFLLAIFDETTKHIAFKRLDLLANCAELRNLSTEGLALLIKEKEQIHTTGTIFRLLTTFRQTLEHFLRDHHLARDLRDYVDAFVHAAIYFLGKDDAVCHLLGQNLPEEAVFFGSRLKKPDLVMMAAVWKMDNEMVSLLFESGDLGSQIHPIAQYLACFLGSLDTLRIITQHSNPPVDASCGFLGNALRAAVSSGNLDVIKDLISRGADVNIVGNSAGRPLCLAIYGCNIDAARLLLEAGASILAPDGTFQQYALYAAAYPVSPMGRQCSAQMIQLLLEHGSGEHGLRKQLWRALYGASYDGNDSAVRVLLDFIIQFNPRTGLDDHLHGAIRNAVEGSGSVEVAKLLLDKGATLQDGRVVYLQRAIDRKLSDLARFFLNLMTDDELSHEKGQRALELAILRGNVEIFEALLARGVPFDLLKPEKIEALFNEESFNANPELSEMLMHKGVKFSCAFINAVFRSQDTSLMEKVLQNRELHEAPREATSLTLREHDDVDIPSVRIALQAGLRFTDGSIEHILPRAISAGDASVVECLVDLYRGDQLRISNCSILMVLHTGKDTGSIIDAMNLIESLWPNLISVAQLLDEREVQPALADRKLSSKLQHALENENVALLEFFFQKHGTYGDIGALLSNELASVGTKKWLIDYQLQQKNGDVSQCEGLSEALEAAINRNQLPIVEMLLNVGVRCKRLNFVLWPRDHLVFDVAPPVASTETVLRLQAAHNPWWEGPSGPRVLEASAIEAVQQRNVMQLRILIDLGIDINMAVPEHGTLLSLAAYNQVEEMVRMLLDAGSDPAPCMSRFGDRESAYEMLKKGGNDIIRRLIDKALERKNQQDDVV